jgi:hypothetical protein
MANPEHLAKLKEGVKDWNNCWIAHCIWHPTALCKGLDCV